MAKSEDTDILAEALTDFEQFSSAWSDNFKTYKDDLDFVLLENQWPDDVKEMRSGRPMLTINKLRAHGRQVINDARQNKQQIKVHPVDSEADVETADVFNGLIRHIEMNSKADAAYDTAGECAVWGGFGYLRITLDYAYDDTFDMDIGIKRVVNPLAVLGDPASTEADSCDWNKAFVTEWLSDDQFEQQYGDKSKIDWRSDSAWSNAPDWRDKEQGVLTAEYWTREKVDKPIVLLSDGQVMGRAELEQDENTQALLAAKYIEVVDERIAKSWQVTQRIMTGAEVLSTRKWPGIYIPIVPFYGDEFYVDGKRYLRSLIHSAIGPQRLYNYHRSAGAELIALAPKAPWVGPKGAFVGQEWKTANSKNHPYLEWDPKVVKDAGMVPQRQPLDPGPALGSIQESMSASDDIKSTLGMFDASLGKQSNETSGKAILARQREGDVATFHFVDNRSRAIAHTGRILVDLIPKVYSSKRVIRIVGENGKQQEIPLGQPVPVTDQNGQPVLDENGQPQARIYDLGRGKYDLTVATGPSFTTRREEAANAMTELIRADPSLAPIIAPRLAKNLDFPEADDIAKDLEQRGQVPPEVQQQMDEAAQTITKLQEENQQLKMDQSAEMAKLEMQSTADAAELRFKEAAKQAEIASEERIAMAKLAMEERIAERQAELDAKVAAFKAQTTAKASVAAAAMKPQPQNGAAK